MTYKSCPICGRSNMESESASDLGHDMSIVRCISCGRFLIHYRASLVLKDYSKRHMLAGVAREASIRATIAGSLNGDDIRQLANISTFDFDSLIHDVPTTVPEKVDRLLMNIASMVPLPGESAIIDYDNDQPLGYAASEDELRFYVKYLTEAGYLPVQNTLRTIWRETVLRK